MDRGIWALPHGGIIIPVSVGGVRQREMGKGWSVLVCVYLRRETPTKCGSPGPINIQREGKR